MTTFILSLGTLVDTKAEKAIAEFVRLAMSQKKNIDIKKVIPALQTSFADFNLGKISENDLKEILEKALDITMTDEDFLNAWNAMCTVNHETRAIIKYINVLHSSTAYDVSVCIYADTNRTHVAHIQRQLEQSGISSPEIHTTFAYQAPKPELLKKIIQEIQAVNPKDSIVVLLGNTDRIVEETIASIVNERDTAIQAVALTVANVKCVKLEDASLTQPKFAEIIASHGLAERVQTTVDSLLVTGTLTGTGAISITDAHIHSLQFTRPAVVQPFLPPADGKPTFSGELRQEQRQ